MFHKRLSWAHTRKGLGSTPLCSRYLELCSRLRQTLGNVLGSSYLVKMSTLAVVQFDEYDLNPQPPEVRTQSELWMLYRMQEAKKN
jgi:hypothetical protein